MICFIDFETTGLVKPGNDFMVQPGITQIGAVRVDDSFTRREPAPLRGEFSMLVNPEKQIEEVAAKMTGINNEKVANEPTFFSVFPAFAEFALGCDTWAGYNTKFDRDVLAFQLQRYGFERNFPWPVHELDVMKLASDHMAMQGKRGTKRPKLTEIYQELFGESFSAHDALSDIKATVRVWETLNGEA